jgi:hypothetical protein
MAAKPSAFRNMTYMTTEEFKAALIDRYLQPVECLGSRAELERLLQERKTFFNAQVFMEMMEQLHLIFAELKRLADVRGDIDAADLAEQATGMSLQAVELGQKLAIKLPQAVVNLEIRKSSPSEAI